MMGFPPFNMGETKSHLKIKYYINVQYPQAALGPKLFPGFMLVVLLLSGSALGPLLLPGSLLKAVGGKLQWGQEQGEQVA